MAENFTSPCKAKCLMATALNTVEIGDRQLEQLAPGHVRIKTEYSQVSTGTELHFIQGTHTRPATFPCATGYIAIGHVVGVGDGVEKLSLGERVLFGFAHFEMIDSPVEYCTPVPEGIPSTDAVCTSLLAISLRGVRAAKIQLGDSVAVFGQGVIGAFATGLAKLSGACPVISVDPIAKRREVARKMGADVTIDPMKEDVSERIKVLTGGVGVRTAIEASATTKVVASLPALTAREGRIVVLGGIHGEVKMDLYTYFQKSNQTMIGCGSAYHADYPYDTESANFEAILRMFQAGMIKPQPVITHTVGYTDGPKMYKMLMERNEEVLGVQFDWRR